MYTEASIRRSVARLHSALADLHLSPHPPPSVLQSMSGRSAYSTPPHQNNNNQQQQQHLEGQVHPLPSDEYMASVADIRRVEEWKTRIDQLTHEVDAKVDEIRRHELRKLEREEEEEDEEAAAAGVAQVERTGESSQTKTAVEEGIFAANKLPPTDDSDAVDSWSVRVSLRTEEAQRRHQQQLDDDDEEDSNDDDDDGNKKKTAPRRCFPALNFTTRIPKLEQTVGGIWNTQQLNAFFMTQIIQRIKKNEVICDGNELHGFLCVGEALKGLVAATKAEYVQNRRQNDDTEKTGDDDDDDDDVFAGLGVVLRVRRIEYMDPEFGESVLCTKRTVKMMMLALEVSLEIASCIIDTTTTEREGSQEQQTQQTQQQQQHYTPKPPAPRPPSRDATEESKEDATPSDDVGDDGEEGALRQKLAAQRSLSFTDRVPQRNEGEVAELGDGDDEKNGGDKGGEEEEEQEQCLAATASFVVSSRAPLAHPDTLQEEQEEGEGDTNDAGDLAATASFVHNTRGTLDMGADLIPEEKEEEEDHLQKNAFGLDASGSPRSGAVRIVGEEQDGRRAPVHLVYSGVTSPVTPNLQIRSYGDQSFATGDNSQTARTMSSALLAAQASFVSPRLADAATRRGGGGIGITGFIAELADDEHGEDSILLVPVATTQSGDETIKKVVKDVTRGILVGALGKLYGMEDGTQIAEDVMAASSR